VCGLAVSLLIVAAARGQTECGAPAGGDVIIGDIGAVANYSSAGGIAAFSMGNTLCNVGNAPLNFVASTNQHPISGQNLFRLKSVNGAPRFEQIGQSWLHHEFFALSGAFCCTECQPTDGSHLGVRCSSPTTASSEGYQQAAGPKYQLNAATGMFPYPPANPAFGGPIARRLQVKIADIDPAQDGGGMYFAELQVVSPDDAAAGHKNNNASYRPCSFAGGGASWTMALSGATQRERQGIRAWKDADSSVSESEAQVPGDGLFILAAKATPLGSGVWHYEYALANMNSDRSGQSFSVSIPVGAALSNIGFHDVDYHDGDGGGNVNFDGTDWPATIAGGTITWTTQTFAENANANALRWGTLYNFRFDIAALPITGNVTLGLFKPGSPTSVTLAAPVPGFAFGDFDGDGDVDLADFAHVPACLTGPIAGPLAPGCAPFDSDSDSDVDLHDAAVFGNLLTGP
jgi:hypothetical protein